MQSPGQWQSAFDGERLYLWTLFNGTPELNLFIYIAAFAGDDAVKEKIEKAEQEKKDRKEKEKEKRKEEHLERKKSAGHEKERKSGEERRSAEDVAGEGRGSGEGRKTPEVGSEKKKNLRPDKSPIREPIPVAQLRTMSNTEIEEKMTDIKKSLVRDHSVLADIMAEGHEEDLDVHFFLFPPASCCQLNSIFSLFRISSFSTKCTCYERSVRKNRTRRKRASTSRCRKSNKRTRRATNQALGSTEKTPPFVPFSLFPVPNTAFYLVLFCLSFLQNFL